MSENTTVNSSETQVTDDTRPKTVVQLYHNARKNELADATRKSQQYRLKKFVQWCDDEGIEDTTVLTGRQLYEFRISLQGGSYGDLSKYTVVGIMTTVRHFIGFCERIEACDGGLSEKILVPKIDDDEQSRESFIETDVMKTVLERLRKYEYASKDHVVLGLQWSIGCRIGGIRALDVGDFSHETNTIELHHRPNENTPLKNKKDGERPVALSEQLSTVVNDYIEHNRLSGVDDYGRKPLITTTHGRISDAQIRRVVAYNTQPCHYGPCPIGRTPDDCEHHIYHEALGCPPTHPSHDVRRGRITDLKSEQLPMEVISDRVDASPDTIEQYYDERDDDERMELRRSYLEDTDSI